MTNYFKIFCNFSLCKLRGYHRGADKYSSHLGSYAVSTDKHQCCGGSLGVSSLLHLHGNLAGDTAYTSTLDANRRSTAHTVRIKCDYVTQRTPAPTVDYIKCKYIGLITTTHI